MGRIALLSYNPIRITYEVSNQAEFSTFPNAFKPKSRNSVTINDPVWQSLVIQDMKQSFDAIFIFIGKKSSGALEVIELVARFFETSQERITFVSCSCDLVEKQNQLMLHGFKSDALVVFQDDFKPCREWDWLFFYANKVLKET